MSTEKQGPAECKALLDSLESVVMHLNDMENMIENFEDATAEPFFSKVNEYIGDLQEVERLAPSCHLQVPREALERLDDDVEQNPELFSQELLSRCKDEFGQLNTRVVGIQKVRQIVMDGWKARSKEDIEAMPQDARSNGPKESSAGPSAGEAVGGVQQNEAGQAPGSGRGKSITQNR